MLELRHTAILGKNAAIAVIVIDILKGIIACVIGGLLVGNIETFGYMECTLLVLQQL